MNQRIIDEYARRLSTEQGRPIGRGEAEADIHRTIQQVARSLAPKYTFGYHSRLDIEQDAFVLALEVLQGEGYDPTRPLANFLYVHLRRRLSNQIRKSYYRVEPPCTCCDPSNPPEVPCRKWSEWHKRNMAKQNLMRPLDVAAVDDQGEPRMASPSSAVEDAAVREMISLIDGKLPVDLRADYLRMREHVSVPKARRHRVREAVLSILKEQGHARQDEEEEARPGHPRPAE